MHHKRFESYDRVSLFKVTYKGKRVRLELGSELFNEFDESDGRKILERIDRGTTALGEQTFDRKSFFLTVKNAIHMMRNEGLDRDGWVSVRTLYVYVALLRNLQFENFMKNPAPRNFRLYSTAQFVFDLARFGQMGWTLGEEILRGMTPNMATVAAGKAMTLPDLDNMDVLGPQFAQLKIEKKV